MKRSNNYATAINDKDGNKIDTNEGIRKVYKDFYKELLSGNNATTEEEIDREKEVEELFQKVMEAGKLQRPIKVDDSDVREAIGNLKKKKAKDIQGWRNEIVIEGGEEMVISIKKMCNEIITKEELPIDWEEMIINSIHKKGSIFDMNNKRGLFLTNILSKVFEKVLSKKIGDIEYDELQNGGRKGRSPVDNWMILMAVRDHNRNVNQNTYIYFADLMKCFDRLWLKDCVVDLWKAGVREKEARLVYLMNKEARIWIKTPVGITDEIKIEEVVKQGTIFGPKLCCVATGAINKIVLEL